MCVIIATADKKLPVDELESASWYNPDGFGVAWLENGLVRYSKFREFNWKKWRQPDGPVVLHFRLATAGEVMPELCHPFPISRATPAITKGVAKRVLFHNGHVGEWKSLMQFVPASRRGGPWSDSRVVAHLIYQDGTKGLGDGWNRYAIFGSESPRLTLYGDWSEDGGIYRSNRNHLDDWTPIGWDDYLLDTVPPTKRSAICLGR